MKLLYLLLLVGNNAFGQTSLTQIFDQISSKIGTGNCTEAEVIARLNTAPPIQFTTLGLIQLECYKNKNAAIDFFVVAARMNESLAIEKLLTLGISPPQIIQKNQNTGVYLPPPPPMPIPEQSTQRLIITPQYQAQPMLNPNSCMQDGGSLYCPNHPNTRIIPFKK
jgi:hypothetical protein